MVLRVCVSSHSLISRQEPGASSASYLLADGLSSAGTCRGLWESQALAPGQLGRPGARLRNRGHCQGGNAKQWPDGLPGGASAPGPGAGEAQAGARAAWTPATPALGTQGHQGGQPPPQVPQALEPGHQSPRWGRKSRAAASQSPRPPIPLWKGGSRPPGLACHPQPRHPPASSPPWGNRQTYPSHPEPQCGVGCPLTSPCPLCPESLGNRVGRR